MLRENPSSRVVLDGLSHQIDSQPEGGQHGYYWRIVYRFGFVRFFISDQDREAWEKLQEGKERQGVNKRLVNPIIQLQRTKDWILIVLVHDYKDAED